MNELISSKDTIRVKYIMPLFAFFFGSFCTLLLWLGDLRGQDGAAPSETFKIVFTLGCIAIFLIILAAGRAIKKVSITNEGLLIEGYFKKGIISFYEIEGIERNLSFTRPLAFTLKLRKPCILGKSINFFPILPYFRNSEKVEEVLEELRKKILRH